ncbi:hypothetical protein DH2020_016243 [Rehmannia glutinosa]|uniref:Sey1/RHD3-like three-helix bundle domain-containing protein n=1 Tax=Rehmannia glutinosa TaxID=99300 RepID=A0ABR0WME7_REHGL
MKLITWLLQPAYQFMLGHIRSGTLDKFKAAFDSALNEGKGFAAAARDCTEYFMSQFDEESAEKLNEAISGRVEALLDGASNDTWPAIRKLFRHETDTAVTGFSGALSGFEMDEVTKDKMLSRLEDHARGLVEAKAKEEAGRVLIRMKDSQDSDSMPRVWTGKEVIRAITKTARSASLKILSVMAAIHLDDDADNIESTLSLALVDPKAAASTNRSISVDPLASSSWDEVPSSKTLLTPVQCKSLWRQFKSEMEYTVSQAIATQLTEKIMAGKDKSVVLWSISDHISSLAKGQGSQKSSGSKEGDVGGRPAYGSTIKAI